MAQEIADSKLIDTWSSDGLKVKPDISKIIEGWQLGEQPPHEYMNWLQNTFGSKLNHILKNGVASWSNTTQYLAGSSVQYGGNVWLCKTTNTNSAPTDVNANWKRIITVEALTTVLDGYVATTGNQTIAGVKTFSSTISGSINGNAGTVTNGVYTTGDQTIAGVKTFSSSPIVPTPTTETQATNKAYVDSVAVTPDASTTVKGIVELATTAEAQAGADDLRAITPLKLRNALNATGAAPIYASRAWINFNGTGAIAIRASGNVSSITDIGTGNYTINMTTPMPDANYAVSGSAGTGATNAGTAFAAITNSAPTTTSFNIATWTTGANTDYQYISTLVLR